MDERYLAFYARMSTRVDELRALYTELYHSQEAFAAFCEMLRVSLDRRKESLRQMDHDREENPSWYRDRQMLGYVVYTQCFAHDLRGVKERLPYLQENGVTYLHLMPLLESPAGRSDGGYAVADFGRVQPNLGTMDDLEKLAELKYGRLPELEKKLEEEKAKADAAQEARLLKEEVGEEEIAEVISGWTEIVR